MSTADECGAFGLQHRQLRDQKHERKRGSPKCISYASAHAHRGTFGLDRTRWRRTHRRSCKSQAPEPHSCMRLPWVHAISARNRASRQQAAHRKQAASPDIEWSRRRVRVVMCCCCCYAVVSWQRSTRASLRERTEPRAGFGGRKSRAADFLPCAPIPVLLPRSRPKSPQPEKGFAARQRCPAGG